MSFLKKLFGGGPAKPEGPAPAAQTLEYEGYVIEARPFKEGGQYQTAGVVWKMADGVKKEHSFIRADRFASAEDAANHAIFKGKQIVDQMGEAMFR